MEQSCPQKQREHQLLHENLHFLSRSVTSDEMTQGMETDQYIGTGLVLVCEKEWCICCFESAVLSERRGKTQPDNVDKCVDAITSKIFTERNCMHAINNVIMQVELDVFFSYVHSFFP
jgi:hypothetical protein